MELLPEEESVSIVLVGNMNPPIFTPQWFQANELIDAATANSAKIEIIHQEVAIFTTDWFRLQAETGRLVIVPIRTANVRAFDLCLRMFTEFLPHTPVRAVGLNYLAHYKVASWTVFHAVGDALAPKDAWGEWGANILQPIKTDTPQPEGLAGRSGGLRAMTMEQSVRPDGLSGYIRAKAEVSEKYKPGLYFEINDHYMFNEKESRASAAMGALRDKFDASINRSKWIISQVIGQIPKQ